MQGTDIYMLWLIMLCRLPHRRIRELLEFFGSAEAVFSAGKDELERSGASRAEIGVLSSRKDMARLEGCAAELEGKGIGFVSVEDNAFPWLLRHIGDCPPGLFYKGVLPENDGEKLCIAIIGARDCSDYGLSSAYKLSAGLAGHGVTIVSGLARGVDGMAHRAALDAGGYTIAVLGTAIDEPYPRQNEDIYREIIEKGCVVSEYPPGTAYNKGNFPQRNRIISGLSHGIVVVEAELKSGTSITVSQAADQGREVFAVPGNITSEKSAGTNNLIRDGAVMATSYEDILQEFCFMRRCIPKISVEKRKSAVRPAPAREAPVPQNKDTSILEHEAKIIYDSLVGKESSADEILGETRLSIQSVLYSLTMLEIMGYVEAVPGGKFRRK